MNIRTLAVLALCLVAPAVFAQQASEITLERLFSSPEFYGQRAGQSRWLDDNNGYTMLERSATLPGGVDLVRHDPSSGGRDIIVPAQRFVPAGASEPLAIEDYDWSSDGLKLLIYTNSERVWRANTRGDYWVLDIANGTLKQLGGGAPASTMMFAKFSPDGTRVGYVQGHNLYVQHLADGKIDQLTSDGSEKLINGTFDWVYEEEFFLRDGWRWSPDGRSIAFWQLDATGVRDFLMINNTDSLYSFTIPVQYPKAGTTNSSCRVGVIPAAGGDIVWFEPSDDLRNHYIARMEWAANSDEIVMQHLNRQQNRLEVILGNARTGEMRTVLTEVDDAWIDVQNREDFRWLAAGKRFTWVSERDGWRRVYLADRATGALTPITPEAADVLSIVYIDEKGGWLYYMASPDNATQQYLYRALLNGKGKVTRLTPENQPGTHSYDIAPGAKWAFHTYSSFGVPPVTELVSLPKHRTLQTVVDNAALKGRLAGLSLGKTRFLRIDIGDGVELDAYEILPPDFDPSRKYPVLFHVYGEPWSQTVVDRWGGHQYLWHQMLAQQGYIVMSVDNRGTPGPRGRDWRKIVHGSIGVLASADQAAAARKVAEWPYVDASRIAIWGWSGGGSMTLNAMFRYPEVYNTGMSVAPVPDQRYYDTIYQERYMGLPQENPDGYRQGSPINFAEHLRGNLLLVHGTGDDNVHYQGSEALINKLVQANRPFTMMAYPNRSHGIFEGPGTTRHLYELLTRYLKQNMPPGPQEGSGL
ncbi:MAG: S9 family peptidase [Rhodothermales bacterium]